MPDRAGILQHWPDHRRIDVHNLGNVHPSAPQKLREIKSLGDLDVGGLNVSVPRQIATDGHAQDTLPLVPVGLLLMVMGGDVRFVVSKTHQYLLGLLTVH